MPKRPALPNRVAIAIALIAGVSGDASAQASGNLAGAVLSRLEGRGLARAVIALPDLRIERFTTASGSFHFSGIAVGPVRVQVRRIGYAPRELTVVVRADMTERVQVELDPVAVPLTPIRVTAYPPCIHPGPPDPHTDSTLATLFAQVALNARQYRLLAEQYPFHYVMVASRGLGDSARLVADGLQDTARISGLPDWRYRPGKITTTSYPRRRQRHQMLHVLTLTDLADESFVNSHCFHHAGIESNDGLTAHRIDFTPASRIGAPDFAGEIYLDTGSYQIRRTVFRVHPVLPIRGLTSMSVTTDFAEVLPGIPVIANVFSIQRYDRSVRGVRFSRAFETQWIIDFKFTGRRPDDPVP